MAAADKPDAENMTAVDAQRGAKLLVAPGHAVYPGEPNASDAPDHEQRLAERAVEALFARDTTLDLLGFRLLSVRPGGARVGMTVRHDMVNGHRTCHGGLIFSLADSAFAAACNSHNENNVAACASIDFLAPGVEGDELVADASEVWRAGRTGIYEIKVTNQRGELIALFRGRSHRIGGAVTTD
jgi:acyl-CoA thioesterase